MLIIVIVSIISFVLGFIVKGLILKGKRKKSIKIKPLSKMTKKEFKQAMKDLEIK